MGGTADNCYKTKGMMTGKDGKFSFPLESPKSDNPEMVYAIKADYYWHLSAVPTPSVQRAQTKETYSNRHVYLKKQDPKQPEFVHGFGHCQRPESTEAIEAATQFMQIEMSEVTKYGNEQRALGVGNLMKSMQQSASSQTYKNR